MTTVIGIGVDVVENERVATSIERFGDRFLGRIYLPDEIGYCQSMKHPVLHFSARFAAKEAVSKAFGTGIGSALGWKSVEVRRKPSGEPYVVLHERGRDLARKRGVREVMVSLSHSKYYSVANAVLIGGAVEAT
jgi:holo-[acyl-carrier protein] synthase